MKGVFTMSRKAKLSPILFALLLTFLPLTAMAAADDAAPYAPYDLTAEAIAPDQVHPNGSARLTLKIDNLPRSDVERWFVLVEKKIGNDGTWKTVSEEASNTYLDDYAIGPGQYSYAQIWNESYEWDSQTPVFFRVKVVLYDDTFTLKSESAWSDIASIGVTGTGETPGTDPTPTPSDEPPVTPSADLTDTPTPPTTPKSDDGKKDDIPKTGDSKGLSAALYGFLKHCGQSESEISKLYFINRLPDDVLDENPFLYISCAYGAFLLGEAKSMFFYLDRIYDRLHGILREHMVFFEGILILVTLDPRYSFAEQAAKFGAGLKIGKGLPRSLKSLNHNLPYFHRTFRDFSHYGLNMEVGFDEFRLIFYELLGNDYEIIESGVRSGLLYEKNLLKEAAALINPNPDTDSAELKFLSKMHSASYALAMGKEEDSARYRAEIRALIDRENLLHLLPVFSAYETKIELLKGNRKAAAAWLDNYFVIEDQRPELNKIFLHFTTVRAYIVLGEVEKARKMCEKLKRLAADFSRFLDEAEATVLLVVLMWLTGERQEAAILLQKTLADMEPYYFIRIFADEGKPILPVLKKLLKQSEKKSDPNMPGYKYLQVVYLAAYEQSKRYKGMASAAELRPVKLSRQQKYVLELLAKGYKNAEIVKLTGLSINTIRVHTKVAYQKLEVNNAMDAVLRARELGLIP